MDKTNYHLPKNVGLCCYLSTAHITKQTDELLKAKEETSNTDNTLPVYFPKRIGGELYGYIFVVSDWDDDEELSSSCPIDLANCLHYAAHLGCDLLVLDGVCEVVPELPTHEW